MSCPVLEYICVSCHIRRVSCDLQNDTLLVFVGDVDFVSFDLCRLCKDSLNAHSHQAEFSPHSIQGNHLKVCSPCDIGTCNCSEHVMCL